MSSPHISHDCSPLLWTTNCIHGVDPLCAFMVKTQTLDYVYVHFLAWQQGWRAHTHTHTHTVTHTHTHTERHRHTPAHARAHTTHTHRERKRDTKTEMSPARRRPVSPPRQTPRSSLAAPAMPGLLRSRLDGVYRADRRFYMAKNIYTLYIYIYVYNGRPPQWTSLDM